MPSAGVALRPEPASVRDARRYVGEAVATAGYDAAVTTAELLVSELVTNAVLHARTPLRVTVEPRGENVRVCVADESLRSPLRRRHGIESATGRGLMLVERMASRWGVDVGTAGKVVWFELSRDPADAFDGWDDAWEA